MKTKLITILLSIVFLASGACYSQARIGFTESEIRQEFWYVSWDVEYGSTGIRMISGSISPSVSVIHAFEKNGKCYMTSVYPKTNQELIKRISFLNNTAEKVDDTTWIDGPILVELVTGDYGAAFFMRKL